jgi:site-specific DNA recombinase
MQWLKKALRSSHDDEAEFHNAALARLQSEYSRLQRRMDVMYDDKLDGRIDQELFDGKATEIRAEQDRILRTIGQHQSANQVYFDEGLALLDADARARQLFERQEPAEQRKLLNYLVSNCSWRDGQLSVEYRQPFNIIARMALETKH